MSFSVLSALLLRGFNRAPDKGKRGSVQLEQRGFRVMMNDTMSNRAAPCRTLQEAKMLFRHVLAVIGFTLFAGQAAFAQAVVTPSCPPGYTLSGNQCVQGSPTPSCPSGYHFSGGQCVANSAAPKPTKPVAPTNEFAHLNCNQLWHARNKIFAEHGYCFKTARAKKAFPNNCFPPYGENLPAWARNDVGWIKEVEKSKRC
jgi:hypothetical protein